MSLKILVTGATGLIGSELVKKLISLGHQVIVIGRSSEESFRKRHEWNCDYISWSQIEKKKIDSQLFSNLYAVVNLAGDSLADGFWTSSKKKLIYDSRVQSTNKLINVLNSLPQAPQVFVSASAIGYYGDCGDVELTEASERGQGFLADVCSDWEMAALGLSQTQSDAKSLKQTQKSKDLNVESLQKTRIVLLRIGIVFSSSGGFLEKMKDIFKTGLGGVIGSGQQWMSWISKDDLVNLIIWSIQTEKVSGALNAVSPTPVRHSNWAKVFADVIHRPLLFKIPSIALKLMLGQKSELALQSQRVLPAKALSLGFQYQDTDLKTTLIKLLRGH